MQVISVTVGRPRPVLHEGEVVQTGIFKEPVIGRVAVRRHNLEGDEQADLSVHGGKYKAVYAYPSEHYGFWRREFPEMKLPWGMFGENLTTAGLVEDSVHIGDRFRVGTAELIVTQPRLPCFKLGIKFGRADIIKRFLQSGLTGFYFAVISEGEVGAGDSIQSIQRDPNRVAVADVVRLHVQDQDNVEMMKRALRVDILPLFWQKKFRARLAKLAPSEI